MASPGAFEPAGLASSKLSIPVRRQGILLTFWRGQDLHDLPLGGQDLVPPYIRLEPLRQRYEIRVAIWVLQIRRLPVSTIEDEFGAAHARCCGGRVVVHDRDQRLQRISVIPPRRLCQGRLQLNRSGKVRWK
jgi:hypothetical protein